MKIAIVAAQAIAALITTAVPAASEGMRHEIIMQVKECSSILAGMANDAKADPSVSVTYEGTSLALSGNGRSYAAWCKNGRVFFSGSYEVAPQ